MDNPLSKLALDHWYQVLVVVGIIVFMLTGTGVLAAFPTAPTALISLGLFWVGLGEWTNHPLQTTVLPGGIITGHPRNTEPVGIFFDVLGFVLIFFGCYKFFA